LNIVELQPIKELLLKSKNILIISHSNPDGDAIGSALALGNYFFKKSFNVMVAMPDDFPDYLAWINNASDIKIYSHNKKEIDDFVNLSDIIFCVDFNSLNRLKSMEETVKNSKAKRILIDHHINPEVSQFNFCITTLEVSSTSEMVYDFITSIYDADSVDIDIATSIYVGIMTDTGSFSYSCNYKKTFEIVAKLIDKGINPEIIHRKVYDTFSESRLRLLGYSLSEKLVVLSEYSTAYIWLDKNELDNYNYKVGDTEGLVNYALAIDNIKFAALFTERDNTIRISFRSKGDFNVNDYARMYFNGGGHKNASGATSFFTMQQTIELFLKSLKKYKNILNSK
jgi:phosphoesterase RecJ-like protein